MKKGNKEKKRAKKKIIKAPRVQTIFCIVSLVFVLGCIGFYGSRLVKYYKIYNPKSETGEVLSNLSSKIISSSKIVYEGDGLYISNGNYVYKGNDVNNYILVNNMLFRIVRINTDKTIDIALDDYINKLMWNEEISSFQESSIYEYLNTKFLSTLDKNLLTNTDICTDPIYELSEVKCDNSSDESFVRLLGITDFLNSINDDESYLIKNSEYLWLYNYGKNNVWHTNGMNIANSLPTNAYSIKPVVTLKNSAILRTGEGTKENPYQIDQTKQIGVGTYLDINDDIYIVYEVGDDYLKVQSNKLLSEKLIFDNTSNEYAESSIKEYLETTFVDSLSYKNLLKEVKFDDYESSVGLLTLNDLKFNPALRSYFLTDKRNDGVYLYNATVVGSDVSTKRNVRACLGLAKDIKIISGNGSKLAPFIVEV